VGESQTEETEEENKMKRLLIALTAGLFAVSSFAGQPAEYNKPTTVTGTLVYLENPLYGSTEFGPSHSHNKRYFALKLSEPLDFAGDEYDAESNITTVQLAGNSDKFAGTKWVGKKVTFSGEFYHRDFAHQHQPVLFLVKDLNENTITNTDGG
jgi:hypothetical protein